MSPEGSPKDEDVVGALALRGWIVQMEEAGGQCAVKGALPEMEEATAGFSGTRCAAVALAGMAAGAGADRRGGRQRWENVVGDKSERVLMEEGSHVCVKLRRELRWGSRELRAAIRSRRHRWSATMGSCV